MTPLPQRLPLRTQVLLLLLGTVVLVVVTTALAGTAALRSYLLDRVDQQLAVSTGDVAHLAGRPDPDGDGRGPGRGGRAGLTSFVAALYDTSGTLVTDLTPRVVGTSSPRPRLPALTEDRVADLDGAPFTVGSTSGDDQWRVRVSALDGGSLVVAAPLGDVDDTVRRLLLIDSAVGLLALTGAGCLAWVGVRRSLRPLQTVEATAEAIAAGDLSVRVPPADPRTEVGSLSASFNSMVDRFESAYRAQQDSEAQARASEDRMRRFIGDASHELRTPLTSIRGFAELFRQGAVPEPDRPRVMQRIEDEASRMGLLVEDLLLLARLDQQRPLLREPVDLLAVASDVVHDAQAVRADHTVRLAPPPAGPPLVVLGDDARLRQVLGNLVTNAAVHTPAGTTVEVSLWAEGGAVLVAVSDDGPGMEPDVAARVFERFYRADSSRTRGTQQATGSGLGLSIVAALVAAHGGSVVVDSVPGSGTTFTVRLPAR